MKRQIVGLLAMSAALPLFAKIEMGAPFTDGAVLQRGMKLPVWGKAAPGNEVTVAFAGEKATVVAGADGAWRVDLEPLAASKEGRTLVATECEPGWFGSTVDEVEVKDILVGEVWFASGQSNMECPIWGGNSRYRDGNGALVTAMDNLPDIRYVSVQNVWSVTPRAQKAVWRKYVPADVLRGKALSAVAYYYARELYLALGIPVGIVAVNWGGTNIDAWTPRCGYEGCDESIRHVADYEVKPQGKWDPKKDKSGPIGGIIQQPTVLWNGMVAAFAPLANRGFIWYQGCHNSGESHLYCAKLHALYNGWSKSFENPNLKFYIVELAPYSQNWLGIAAAQRKFAAEQPNAAIASTADVGNFSDIHPNKKEIVAKRLAVHALKRDYGFAIPCDSSPVLKDVSFANGKASLTFANAKGFYVYADNCSRAAAFELAGADGAWAAAKIVNWRQKTDRKTKKPVDSEFIDGDTIVLASEKVPAPVKVRYMGQPRTMGTVYNEMSLPLGPFER